MRLPWHLPFRSMDPAHSISSGYSRGAAEMKPTSAQHEAIHAPGNLLVVAGAGAGKTRTLVERCLQRMRDDPERPRIDQMLIVTFTEAAATEMRERLRTSLEAE